VDAIVRMVSSSYSKHLIAWGKAGSSCPVGPNPLLPVSRRFPSATLKLAKLLRLWDSRTHACSLHLPLHPRHLGKSSRLVNAEDHAFAGRGPAPACRWGGRAEHTMTDFSRFRAALLSSGQRGRPPPERAVRQSADPSACHLISAVVGSMRP
jgi:hypothetical protein